MTVISAMLSVQTRPITTELALFDRSISRHLVHKSAVSEVFLTYDAQTGSNSFSIYAQWPRRHFYYKVGSSRIDPVIVAETLRQATIFIAHKYYAVPLAHRFLMSGLGIRLVSNHHREAADSPVDVYLDVKVDRIKQHRQGIVAFRTNVDFYVQGMLIGRGVGDLQIVNPAVYRRLRTSAAGSATLSSESCPPSALPLVHGMRLEPLTDRSWLVEADTSHPVFFDHAVDHLPGLLIVEAARQAANATAKWTNADLSAFDGVFDHFIELDCPTTIRLDSSRLESPTELQLSFSIMQLEVIAGHAAVVLARGLR